MNYSLIDIGSNSIRLNVYEVNGTEFKTLFHSKIMAGLAGYVEKGKLSPDGIEAAVSALSEFKQTLQSLSVDTVSVFATASLRNIKNTNEVVRILNQRTGFLIEIIGECEEAHLGYYGAKLEFPDITEGAFIDIGGASTEIISFSDHIPARAVSCKLGSLSLYKKCVKKIMPGNKALTRISGAIKKGLKEVPEFTFDPRTPLVCVGGTGRAVLKIAKKVFDLPDHCNSLSADQLQELFDLLTTRKRKAARMILRIAPDRIHTIIPGLSILLHILHLYHSETLIVSNYGIREGFLCRKIIQSEKTTTSLPRTGN